VVAHAIAVRALPLLAEVRRNHLPAAAAKDGPRVDKGKREFLNEFSRLQKKVCAYGKSSSLQEKFAYSQLQCWRLGVKLAPMC
jgi:hypothetical protein